jgi:DNA-damage-inducible protein D
MKSDEIRNLFSKFESAASDLEGVECWSARELQELLGYSKWENFEKVIQKAKEACNNAGEEKWVIIFLTSGKRYLCPKVLKKK